MVVRPHLRQRIEERLWPGMMMEVDQAFAGVDAVKHCNPVPSASITLIYAYV